MSYQPELLPPSPLTVAQAIARVEGWYIQGKTANRPQRNNNPGDLEFHAWMTTEYGATLEQGTPHPRFACFPTAEVGWKALDDLLAGAHYRGLTLAQIVNKYAPPVENDTVNYVELVSRWTARPSDQIIFT